MIEPIKLPPLPTFPVADHPSLSIYPGVSLRDYFAAKAMQGWVAVDAMRFDEANVKRAAQFAYAMADAMLAAREK